MRPAAAFRTDGYDEQILYDQECIISINRDRQIVSVARACHRRWTRGELGGTSYIMVYLFGVL
jgi:hypothetical protein